MENQELTAQLLFKLYRRGIWGARHTPLKNLLHLAGEDVMKDSRKIVKELEKSDFILIKKSTGEDHISLNSHKKGEIRDFILSVLKINPEMLK